MRPSLVAMEGLLSLTTVVGALVLVAVMTDIVVTALVPSGGAGPLTRWTGGVLWRVLRALHDRRPAHRALRAAGPLIVGMVVVMWLVGLIAGWSLVFSRQGSLVAADGSGTPAPVLGRLYYSAATVLGSGGGPYTPGSDVWRAVEQVAAGTGVALIGLTIAYILPIVSAVVQKREVASYISALGGGPDEILVRAYSDGNFGSLHLHFIALTPMINRLAQNHLAYPVLHYFHSGERFTALGPSIVVLDESLTLAEEGLVEENLMDPSSVRPCRAAIDGFLQSLTRVAVVAAEHPLPLPELDAYRETDLPLRPDEEISERYESLRDRRCLLAGFLEHDGWAPQETSAEL